MDDLQIDYEKVEQVVSEIDKGINSSKVEGEYTKLINSFTDSKGEEANELRNLLNEEKIMVNELNMTLRKFAKSLEFAANEYAKFDAKGAAAIAEQVFKTK